jgi:hypothetical protein
VKRNRCAPFFVRLCLLILGAVQIAALMVAVERPAQAYVDPGSGYVLLQIAGSMFAGAVYYLRHRLKRLFTWSRSTSTDATSSSAAEVAENQP